MQFTYSEVLGNSIAVVISNAYYRDNRDAGDAATKNSGPRLASTSAVGADREGIGRTARDAYAFFRTSATSVRHIKELENAGLIHGFAEW